MGLVPIDLTKVGVTDGSFTGVINKVEYITKIGEKWNAAGTQVVEFDEWVGFSDDLRGLNLTITLPEQDGNCIFHQVRLGKKELPFVEKLFAAAQVDYDESGFDPDLLVNQTIGVKIIIDSYGPKIKSFYRV